MAQELYGGVLEPGQRHNKVPGSLAALPLYHSFGQTVVQNGTITSGGTISYLRRFMPLDAGRLIAEEKVTVFAGVPSTYIALNRCAEVSTKTLSSLQNCISGGAPLPLEVKRNFIDGLASGSAKGTA